MLINDIVRRKKFNIFAKYVKELCEIDELALEKDMICKLNVDINIIMKQRRPVLRFIFLYNYCC